MKVKAMDKALYSRNKYFFGLGTVGRDMLYSLVSMYLLFYLTDILNLPDSTMWWASGIFRAFDALNDPFMGILVDNTRSRFGKFKPWIAFGALAACILTVLMFTDYGFYGLGYVALIAVIYLLWDMAFGANDIAYWSMLPSLTLDQKEREGIGAFARICADVGLCDRSGNITGDAGACGRARERIESMVCSFSDHFRPTPRIPMPDPVRGEGTQGLFQAGGDHDDPRDVQGDIQKRPVALYGDFHGTLHDWLFHNPSFGVYFLSMPTGTRACIQFSLLSSVFPGCRLAVFRCSQAFSETALCHIDRPCRPGIHSILSLAEHAYRHRRHIYLSAGIHPAPHADVLADTIECRQWKSGKRNESVTFSVSLHKQDRRRDRKRHSRCNRHHIRYQQGRHP